MKKHILWKRNPVHCLALALVMLAGAACAPIPAAPPQPPAETAPPPALTVEATATQAPTQPAATMTPTVVATATSPAVDTPTPAASPTPAAVGPTPVPPMDTDTDNIWAVLLGATSAPPGWAVAPCEGDGPFLCVSSGSENIGAVELGTYPIETMTDLQALLAAAGISAGRPDLSDPSAMESVLAALESYVEVYHNVIETDRGAEYGDRIVYTRLNTERLMIGSLPAVRYGFTGVNQDGSILERWVSYMAYDGNLLYIIVASYRPDAIPTFRSDEELTQFLPHLTEMMTSLRLPLPVSETSVASVRALRPLDIFRVYGGQLGNPVGQIAAGETVPVTGVSPTGRHWRIACPDPALAACWIAATADATEPAAR